MPTSVKFINRNNLKNNFESKGELVPLYDLRFERSFLNNLSKKGAGETAYEYFDSSTNYIMVKSGANIASFVFLAEITDPINENKYLYIHLNRQLEHNGENFSNMSAGYTTGMTSESRFVGDLSNVIITSISDLKPTFKGVITNINASEVLFKFDSLHSDLIDVGYILSVKRQYANADIFMNDLIAYEKKLIDNNDTSNVPPPKSKIKTVFSSVFLSKP